MAGGGGPPVPEGAGGKKPVDFQINLIPCIDLLSVLISFLLMTSVWTQIAKIDVKQKPTQADEQPEEQKDEDKIDLTVFVKANGYTVTQKNVVVKEIEKKGDEWDSATLAEVLKGVAAEHPENHDVTLKSEDTVPYQELITVMDICLIHKLEGIQVSGVEG